MRFEELENQPHNNLREEKQSSIVEHKKPNNLFPVEVLKEFNNNQRKLKLQLTQLAHTLKKQSK